MQYLIAGAGVLAVGFAGFLFTAATRPKEFRLERSVETDASSEAVYRIISDLARFPEWSPWYGLDPKVATSLSGDSGQVGSSYGWEGNNKVGAGKMTITEAVPNSHVALRLEFLRPFATTNMTEWRISEEGARRRITWTMEGSNETVFQRAFALVANMDKLVGKDFEKGLDKLKRIAEGGTSGDVPG